MPTNQRWFVCLFQLKMCAQRLSAFTIIEREREIYSVRPALFKCNNSYCCGKPRKIKKISKTSWNQLPHFNLETVLCTEAFNLWKKEEWCARKWRETWKNAANLNLNAEYYMWCARAQTVNGRIAYAVQLKAIVCKVNRVWISNQTTFIQINFEMLTPIRLQCESETRTFWPLFTISSAADFCYFI